MEHQAYKFQTREEWLNAFVRACRLEFEARGYTLPSNLRVSVGFTSTGRRGKRIGECWSNTASDDNHFEIFLKPSLDNAARIADVLTHELVHAAVGIAEGHGPKFKACATSLGLGGRMTATVATADWYKWALPILTDLGPIPHAALRSGISTSKPKQKTNLLRVECPECGWLARVTAKHIEPHEYLSCPVPDCDGELVAEGI